MFDDIKDFFTEVIFPVFVIIFLVVFPIVVIFFGIGYYSSCKQAEIYNRQNSTNYSCGDFFWASSQINSQSSTQTIKLIK